MLRKRFLFLFMVIAIGLGLLWIEDYTTDNFEEDSESVSLLPDYYGEGLRNRAFGEEGNLERQFNATSSIHMPASRTTDLVEPRIKTKTEEGETWLIQAEIGVHFEVDKKLTLKENVRISPIVASEIQTPADTMLISTSELTVLQSPQLAKTDQPVEITNINGRINAVGMIIKLDQQRVEFLSKVKARYVP